MNLSFKYFVPVLLKLLFIAFLVSSPSCKKDNINPNVPDVYINVTIDPNSTFYQELNTVGGWMYLTAEAPSRGIIVYRYDIMEFLAYERTPPNEPNKCCTANACTRLIIDGLFAQDTCTGTSYNLLNGNIFEGEGRYPLIRYNTTYNGNLLRIFN